MSGLRFAVARRERTDANYETQPFYAVVYDGDVLVALQFGTHPGNAFQKAWNLAQEHREREPLAGTVNDGR